jgi:hypothetical protein
MLRIGYGDIRGFNPTKGSVHGKAIAIFPKT